MSKTAAGSDGISDPRLGETLKALDPPPGAKLWYGGASPVGALRGVSEREAAWRPAPGRHSIWELVLHMAYWKYAVRRKLTGEPTGGFPRSPANWPAVPDPTGPQVWKEDRTLLRKEHARLVEAIRGLDQALDEPPMGGGGGRTTCADLLMGIVMHDTYHTGQIQLLKRLYAAGR